MTPVDYRDGPLLGIIHSHHSTPQEVFVLQRKERDRDWTASEVRWQDGAICDGAPTELFIPDKESRDGLDAIKRQYCDPCPGRSACLRYALTYAMIGYWGGTDTAERRRLRAKKDRAKCPSCASQRVVNVDGCHDALCLACGMSWLTSSAAQSRNRAA